MFKRKVIELRDVLNKALRQQGLEMPLLQYRLVDAWANVAGELAERHTITKFVKNQTLHVKIDSPALRQDLAMKRTELTKQLNAAVGAFVIADVHIY